MTKMIDFRALLDEQKYNELMLYMLEKAEDMGIDDKEVYYFSLKNALLKVTNNSSKGNAKISLRDSELQHQVPVENFEVMISQSSFNNAVNLFKKLKIAKDISHSYQKRHNFRYKGINIELKYSENWGYHTELSTEIHSEKNLNLAKKKIDIVAKELCIKLMSEQEIFQLIQQKQKKI